MIKSIRNATLVLKESVKGFFHDQCLLHASSLTYYTLLSIIPVLAVALGFAKGFGFEKNLEQELYKRFEEQKEAIDYVVEFARSMLEQVEGGLIAGIGALFLLLFVLSLYWTIEISMNTIWKVKKNRSYLRMFTDYTAMLIISLFFFVISSSLTVFLISQVDIALEQHDMLRKMSPPSFLFYRGLTLLMLWILFSCIYIIMPNTRVGAKYGLLAGVIAGTMYYVMQMTMVQFQIGVSQYNAIYGSFAILPLFLFWLRFSWIIVLFGAEIAYHAEHLSPTLRLGPAKSRMQISKTQLALLLVYRLIKRFHYRKPPGDVTELSKEFGVSYSVIREILTDLVNAGIVVRVRSDKSNECFQPGREIKSITLDSVVSALDKNSLEIITMSANDDARLIKKVLQDFAEQATSAPSNISLYSLLT